MSEKAKGPAAHDEYLHGLGILTPYRKDMIKALAKVKPKKEGGKVNIDDLVNQILKASEDPAKKHWGDGQDHNVKLDYESIKGFIENNEDDIHTHGGLDEELVVQLASIYHNQAKSHIRERYQARLHQMPIDGAKDSIKKIAAFTGNEHQFGHIDKTERHQTLMRRVGMYHDDAMAKTSDMMSSKQYVEKPGYNDFLGYKPKDKHHK